MGWANKLIGWVTGNGVEVDTDNRLLVNLAQAVTPAQVGAVRVFLENDAGTVGVAGTAYLQAPEVDDDYRLRTALDIMLDNEVFNYTAQNTGKLLSTATTFVPAWTTGGAQTNPTSIVATTTGVSGGTYGFFPTLLSCMLYIETKASFTAAPTTNVIIDFGAFIRAAAVPFAPLDGVHFRLTSAGMQGVINFNGTETTTAVFQSAGSATPWSYTLNRKYSFTIVIHDAEVEFWIDDILYGAVDTQAANAGPCMAAALPWSYRHANVGVAGNAISMTIGSYNISFGGPAQIRTPAQQGNGVMGGYQGLAGGTQGSLATYANGANPTAAVPTINTAALGAGLGGQLWETWTAALTIDAIICSYQVPAGSVSVPGKRLVITGISLSTYVQTVLAGGPMNQQYSLAWGHTAIALNTAEASNTKAPRRLALPQFTQTITAAQAVNTIVAQVAPTITFQNPIYVNPGEFVQLVSKKVGTVGTAGVLAHQVLFDYGWE